MSIQILLNIQAFLNKVTATGPECAAWTECANYVQGEIQRLQQDQQAALVEQAVRKLVAESNNAEVVR